MKMIVDLGNQPLKPTACGSCVGSSSDNTVRVRREDDQEGTAMSMGAGSGSDQAGPAVTPVETVEGKSATLAA